MTRNKTTPHAVALGKRMRKARLDRRLQQSELAAAMSTHAAEVSRIENGCREPSLRQCRQAAKKLRVSAAFLIFGRELEVRGQPDQRIQTTPRLGGSASTH